MSLATSILTIVAVIYLTWFLFRKSLNTKNRGIQFETSVYNNTEPPASADLEGKYDVFLSFRGIDTRYGFTYFLYTYLVDAGIYTFRDDNELRIGDKISQHLRNAIEDSKIWIPIFSKNYAYSKWCLIELAHIVKCVPNNVQKIFPIFYDVDVSDVKNQSGSYEAAFIQHEKNFGEVTVKEWRNALKSVGRLKGYELKKETNRHEGVLVKKLVKDIILELKKNYAHVPNDLVGIEPYVQEMTRLLQVNSHGVRIVGIHGMGGIGKTTIAKAIYNKLCGNFDCCCFLEDVQERAKHGVVDLQKQFIFQILKRGFPDITNVNDGIKKIKDVVHRKKILLVLDDVGEKYQFDKIAGECNWFNNASRIIVTTRNKEVLDALEASCSGKGLHEACCRYEPELMSDNDSLQLFSKYAFMRDFPPEDYLSLSQKVTSLAAGLPLVIVTLGSLFLGIRDKASWIAKLKKLEKVPDRDIMGKLRISFDTLDDDCRKIFLDIACFFIGYDKIYPSYMWDDCGFFPEDTINTLVHRSLVKIGDDNSLRMHDQLRDLGRQIVQENYMYKLSRVWRPEDALNVLEGGLGVENVEALNLDLRTLELEEYEKLLNGKREYEQLIFEEKKFYVRRLKGRNFSRLQNLKYLQLGCAILDKDFNNIFSNLRWLKWRCYENFVPINSNLKNLVILDLSLSRITDEWDGWNQFKAAKNLKVLKLWFCLDLITGPNLSTFKNLEILNLGFTLLRRINSSIKNQITLKAIDLSLCKIRYFDCSTFTHLQSLKLDSCTSLLWVSGLEWSKSLAKLSMKGCASVVVLSGLSNLVNLEHLDMSDCKSFETLPDLSNLRMLKKLILKNCSKLHGIEGLEDLMSLEHLDMSGCDSIQRLPDLSNLKMLKVLIFTNTV